MNFAKLLKECQYEKRMTNDAFAKRIGKSRAWLQRIYSKNPKIEKSELSELTMHILNEELGIPFEDMEEYNNYVAGKRSSIKEGKETLWVD